MNAKVGRRENLEEKGLVGHFALGERNERGSKLVDFATTNQLSIKNTMFQKHPRRLYTWTSPDGKTRNQIDYIMIEKRWSSAIKDVTTKPSADCGTDHELLVAVLQLKLKCKKKPPRTIRYDVKDITEDFTIEIKNRFKVLLMDIEEKEPEELAQETKKIYNETAAKHLKKTPRKKQPWISEETLNKIEQRKQTKIKCGLNSAVYKTIAKEVKQLCKRDKKDYLIGKCEKIEQHMKSHRSREMYEEINSLTKTTQPRLGVIKDENGNTDRI